MTKKEEGIKNKITKADELIKNDQWGEAINILNEVLEEDKDNKQAKVKKDQAEQIMKFRNSDIYACTNLHMDPWLDE